MDINQLRPVTFKSYNTVNGRHRHKVPVKGFFHGLINDLQNVDESTFSKTWALIEGGDGQMFKVECDEVKFEDRELRL